MEERSLRKSEFASNTNFLNVCSMPDALKFKQSVVSLPVKYSSEKKNAGESKDELFSG